MHTEVLLPEAKELLPKLSGLGDFYLAGGTAVALQIGHRISEDLDFFSQAAITKTLLPKIEQALAATNMAVAVNNGGELTLPIKGIKCTFLHYSFPVEQPFVEEAGTKILSLPELAATKAYTIGRRGTFKDYVDLYFLFFLNKTTLKDTILLAGKKYGEGFNARLFLEQLLYLEDVPDMEIKFLMPAVDRNEIQIFFKQLIEKEKLV